MVEDVQDEGLIESFGVLADVVPVGGDNLALEFEGALEGFALEVGANHVGHPAEDAEVQEQAVEQREVGVGEGTAFDHVGEEVIDIIRSVALGAQELGEVQGPQRVVRFGADRNG